MTTTVSRLVYSDVMKGVTKIEANSNESKGLPPEIWKTIFQFMKNLPGIYRCVGAISSVCKDFFHFSVVSFPLHFLPSILKTLTSKIQEDHIQVCGNFSGLDCHGYLGTHPDSGISIYKSEAHKGILHVIKPQNEKSRIVEIKLKEALKDKIPDCYVTSYDGLEIVDCHFSGDKCMITCVGLVFFMELNGDKPEFSKFFYPFYNTQSEKHAFSSPHYQNSGGSHISSSAYVDGKLYLCLFSKERTVPDPHYVAYLDTAAMALSAPLQMKLDTNGTADLNVQAIDGRLYHRPNSRKSNMQEIQLDDSLSLSPVQKSATTFPQYISVNGKWGWWGTSDGIRMFDLDTKMYFNIKWEFYNFTQYLISNDVFFILPRSNSNLIKIIYLPTQKDLTELLKPHLAPHLKDVDSILEFDCTLSDEKITLKFLLRKKNADCVNVNITLGQKGNYLEAKKNQAEDVSLQNSAPIKAKSSTCTESKTAFIAAAIFLVLTVSISVTLFIIKPGSVVYHGKGMVLTVPNIATLALGGSAVLLMLALGSYKCWKERQKSVENSF